MMIDVNHLSIQPRLDLDPMDVEDSAQNNKADEKKLIHSQFEDKVAIYGSETIQRLSTIPETIRILERQMTYLENFHDETATYDMRELRGYLEGCFDALNGRSHIPPQVKIIIDRNTQLIEDNVRNLSAMPWSAAILRSIEICTKIINYYRNQCSFDWIGSNYFRDCLLDSPSIRDEKLNTAYTAYFEAIKKIIPAPVNLRRQDVIAETGERLSFLRAGVLSDMRNGYFSLADLIELQGQKRENAWVSLTQKRDQLIQKHKKSTPEAVVLHYACEQLKTEESLTRAITERRSFLQNQMLHLVLEHLKSAQERGSLENLSCLPMMHLSLLNPASQGVDETGWKKDEAVFISDMAQIFREFDGKTLLFDGQGPYIDRNGMIHLGPEYGISDQQLSLKTLFANVSVQGPKQKREVQREINHAFFDTLRDYFAGPLPDDLQSIEQDLQKNSSFSIAERLSMATLKYGLFLSIGCLSAKDRTGFLCGRLGVHHILENGCQRLSSSKKLTRKRRWSEHIFSGPALDVCKDCNQQALIPQNVKALKLIAPTLEDVRTSKRIREFSKLTQMVIQPHSPSAQRNKIPPLKQRRLGLPATSLLQKNRARLRLSLDEAKARQENLPPFRRLHGVHTQLPSPIPDHKKRKLTGKKVENLVNFHENQRFMYSSLDLGERLLR